MQERRVRDEKRTVKIWMAIILAAIMVFSVLGFVIPYHDSNNPYEFNDITFRPGNNVWLANIEGEQRVFYTFPADVLDIPVYDGLEQDLAVTTAYIITFDPDSDPFSLQFLDSIRFDFSRATDKEVFSAMTKPSTQYGLPIITCDNSSSVQRVLFFQESNETEIVKEDDCIILRGQQAEFLRVRDALLMRELGVI